MLAEALETKLDPSRILRTQYCEYVREQRQNEVDQSVLQNAQRCLLEVQQTLQKTEATLQWERWQRQYDSPSNRFKCYSGRPAINPEISYQLKPWPIALDGGRR